MRYHAKFDNSGSNHTSVIMEICETMLTAQAPPFKVIETDMDRSATYDFLVVFHRTVFETKGNIC